MKIKTLIVLFFLPFVSACQGESLEESEGIRLSKQFWDEFVRAEMSGDEALLYSLFKYKDDKLVIAWVEKIASWGKFVIKLNDLFGVEGLNQFNDHDFKGGIIISWPTIHSLEYPRFVSGTDSSLTIDWYNWELRLEVGKNGVLIKNHNKALQVLDTKYDTVKFYERRKMMYSFGYAQLSKEGVIIDDIPNIRNEMFRRFLEIQK
ncbi:MAG: hypothetical protein LAT55_13185 [Opitutales bacterium]|nr:hypothetical protein [Opitutales bacterium]